MKVSSPSSNGKPETDSNNINNPSRSSELVRRNKAIPINYNDLIFIIVSLNIYEIKNTVLASYLVRLGNKKGI